MNWEEFQTEKEFYRKAWENLKAEHTGDLRKYLNKSYLVVSCGWQFGIDDDIVAAAIECPSFFVNEGHTAEFLNLVKKIKSLQNSKTNKEGLEDLFSEVDNFDMESIIVVYDWSIGPIFPTVDMAFIQIIKQSRYCDKKRTKIRAYSIEVVLKKTL